MEPGFYRGDILFLYQPKQPVETGDISEPHCPCISHSAAAACLSAAALGICICTYQSRRCTPARCCLPAYTQSPVLPHPAVVFNTDGREIPIVHRVIKVHQRAANTSHVDILTKAGCGWGTLMVYVPVHGGAAASRESGGSAPASVGSKPVGGTGRHPGARCCLSRIPAPGCSTCQCLHPYLTTAPAPSLAASASQGDNNWGDDRSLYPKGQLWLNTDHIMGKVVG